MQYIQAQVKNKDGTIEGIASTSVLDRQEEVVSVEGWDLKNFKKAPRLLWAHDHTEPAIGKVTKIYYEGEGKKKALKFDAVFQEVTEKARAIKKLVEDGFINTFSVGFKPLEMEGNQITKQELLEISVVNVPANPEAMLLAYKSLTNDGFDSKTIDKILPNPWNDFNKRLEEVNKIATAAQDKADAAVKGLKHLNPHESKQEAIASRLSMAKTIARASDKMLEDKANVPLAKIVKRSSEKLIRELKKDLTLNGKI